jgi:hypothetical protein
MWCSFILCWHTHRATHFSSHVLSSPLNWSTENTCNHKSFSTTKKNTNPLLLPLPPPRSNRTERRTSDNVAAWYIHATPCRSTPRKIHQKQQTNSTVVKQ